MILIIGNHFAGGFEKGSMTRSHIWGVRMLSWLARKRFHTDVVDFHCGLRGLTAEAAKQLPFRSGSMEFATEMIAPLNGARMESHWMSLPACWAMRKQKPRKDGM